MESIPQDHIPAHLEHTSDLATVLLEKKAYITKTTKWALDSILSQVVAQDTLYAPELPGSRIDHTYLQEALAHDPRERYQGKEETLWADEVDYVLYENTEV